MTKNIINTFDSLYLIYIWNLIFEGAQRRVRSFLLFFLPIRPCCESRSRASSWRNPNMSRVFLRTRWASEPAPSAQGGMKWRRVSHAHMMHKHTRTKAWHYHPSGPSQPAFLLRSTAQWFFPSWSVRRWRRPPRALRNSSYHPGVLNHRSGWGVDR